MESQMLKRRFGQILIPLFIVTSIYVPGMKAFGCGKCGEGTYCSTPFQCYCKDGYDGFGTLSRTGVKYCSPKCASKALLCLADTICQKVRLEGDEGYVSEHLCECSSGIRLSRTGQCVGVKADTCEGRCGYGTSCVQGRQCICQEGWYGPLTQPGVPELFCLRMCGSGGHNCLANTTCTALHFERREVNVCDCSAGARRSSTGQCLDIDECVENAGICGNNSICENTEDHYTCACTKGYSKKNGEKLRCNQDINECTETPNICGKNSICTNTEGSYMCACAEGYRKREDEAVGCSQDTDECTDNPGICGNNSVCVNTIGNYTCACAEGYRQRKGEEVGCNLDIDECTQNQTICGNNSVCANTVGNYTCSCVMGHRQREGEDVGCNLVVTAAPPSTAADSSTLTIGLAVGIGGVVLLVVVVLAVVVIFRARNRSSGGVREDIVLEKQRKRSDVIAYENITDQSVQQQRGVTNPTYPALPDVLGSITQLPSGTDVRYEEVNLPPQAELNHDAQSLYSLAGNFDDQTPSENEHKDLYSNHKTADNKAKQMATEKSQASETSPRESTYNVLSKPRVKPATIAATNTSDNYNTLYGLKPNDESLKNIQPGQTG